MVSILSIILLSVCVAVNGAAITMTTVAAPGTNTALQGRLTDQTNPQNYKVVLYVRSPTNAWWGPKPQNGVATPVAADGSFTIANWVSDPNDLNAPAFGLFAIPNANVAPVALNAGQPNPAGAVANAIIVRATWTPGGTGGGAVPPPPVTGTAPIITVRAPPLGSGVAVTGSIANLAPPASNYKLGILLSGNNGGVWWDKTHDYPNGVPQAVVLGIPINADFTFTITGWVADPNDLQANLLRVILVRQSFSFLWPGYQVEGIPWPAQYFNDQTVLAMTTVNRQTQTSTYWAPAGSSVIQPSASSAPAVQPSASASGAAAGGGTGAPSLTVVVPALGTNAPFTGTVAGLANPTGYKVIVYVRAPDGKFWGPKPQAPSSFPVGATGQFTVTGWASSPNDFNAPGMNIYVVPNAYVAPNVLGGDIPAALTSAALLSSMMTRTASGGVQVPSTAPVGSPSSVAAASASAAAAGKPVITVTVPAPGSIAAFTGTITGLANPANYKAVLYVKATNNMYWGPKPQTAVSFPISATGTFTITGWSSDPNDANTPGMAIFVVPNAYAAPAILGGLAIPAALTTAAVASVEKLRADNSGGGIIPPPPVVSPPVTGAGELAWPPTAAPGMKLGAANGFINWAGFRWIVKNTGWNRVGPGNNMFRNGLDNIWVDNWGLHLNIVPSAGCNDWTSSEVWLDHTLGYGTYLHRVVSPVQFLDPDATWSPFFIWDDTGNAGNGWREIDFEHARWGNAGDYTSSQYVLRPLQSGGMVPGWRVRYATNNVPLISGAGPGGGACNNPGQDNFNGGGVSKTTCVLKWFRTQLAWWCFDGHWTLDTIQNAPASKLISAYMYPGQWNNFIPDVGDARVHINLWLQNGAAPRWGRRVHAIMAGFEFRNTNVNIPQANADVNIAQRGLLTIPTENGHVEADESGRLLQDVAAHSSGDPTGKGSTLTIQSLQVEGASLQDLGVIGGKAAVEGAESLAQARPLNAGEVAGVVIGTLVGAVGLFVAGFIMARRRYLGTNLAMSKLPADSEREASASLSGSGSASNTAGKSSAKFAHVKPKD